MHIPSRTKLRHLCLAAIIAVIAAACSVEETLSAPNCQNGESAIIVAQSVPTAAFLPCFTDFPDGWEVTTVNIDQNGTVVRFDSDRAGDGAARLSYDETCDIGQAATVPSDQDGAKRYDFVERIDPGFRAQRYYVFDGGCVWWNFDFDNDVAAALSIELGDTLILFSRDDLNEIVRESFIDAEI